MRTFELEADQLQSREEVEHFLAENNVRKGDTLKLLTEKKVMTFYIGMVLVMVFMAIMSVVYKNKKRREEEGEQILKDVFKGKTEEDIEKDIEKKSGIKVVVERKEKDGEGEFWIKAAAKGVARAYDKEEPDYSDVTLMEPNPNYKPWKKAQ